MQLRMFKFLLVWFCVLPGVMQYVWIEVENLKSENSISFLIFICTVLHHNQTGPLQFRDEVRGSYPVAEAGFLAIRTQFKPPKAPWNPKQKRETFCASSSVFMAQENCRQQHFNLLTHLGSGMNQPGGNTESIIQLGEEY